MSNPSSVVRKIVDFEIGYENQQGNHERSDGPAVIFYGGWLQFWQNGDIVGSITGVGEINWYGDSVSSFLHINRTGWRSKHA